jgi:hypothetical protein
MRAFKLSALAASLAALASASAAMAEPKQLWELTGLKTPESVVADLTSGVIYVSNISGEVTAKDGDGFISQVSLDGRMIKADWVTGLDAPKGLALRKGKLYVADLENLVEIDVKDGKILNKYPFKDAKFTNDVAVSSDDQVFVSDTGANTIWRLADGKFEVWLQDDKLQGPNGLLVQGDQLIVASFGKMGASGPEGTGPLLSVSLADKAIKPFADGKLLGNLDGIEALDATHFLLTDWVAGGLYTIDAETGKMDKLLTLPQGSADIAYIPASKTVLIPQMKEGKLLAYKLD